MYSTRNGRDCQAHGNQKGGGLAGSMMWYYCIYDYGHLMCTMALLSPPRITQLTFRMSLSLTPPEQLTELCRSSSISIKVSASFPLIGSRMRLPSTWRCSPLLCQEADPQYSLNILPSTVTVSPGDSSWQASRDPTITIVAPNLMLFAISPWLLSPPSAMTGFEATLEHHFIADSCHPPVPKPVFRMVMHTLPGPTPILVASAPQFSRSMTAQGVATLPAMTKLVGSNFLMYSIMSLTESACPCAISIVMYQGVSYSLARLSTNSQSAFLTPIEMEAYRPSACIWRTKARLSNSNLCMTQKYPFLAMNQHRDGEITVFMLDGTTGILNLRVPRVTDTSHSARLLTLHFRGSKRMFQQSKICIRNKNQIKGLFTCES